MTTATTASSSPPSSSASFSASTSPAASTLVDLDSTDSGGLGLGNVSSAGAAAGLRLRLNAPGVDDYSEDLSPAQSDVSTAVSPAPSLLRLDALHSPDAQYKPLGFLSGSSRNSAADSLTTKTKTKSKSKDKKRLKSPILDALKLPPLSEISIPRPVQIKFAPLHIPPHRRWQTAAVAIWALLMPICVIIFFFLVSLPFLWPIIIPYVIWINWVDKAYLHGGRPRKWARNFVGWKYFAQYYPCSIVKEAELPPDKRYVFGYHPHGIIGMGALATFATEATGFGEYYPGIKPHLLTLDSNFKIPIYRDLLMALGMGSVARRSCTNILAQGPGSAITIVVGGAAESLAAHPGTHDLTLKKRFGFIKVAIREGADLVPVFSFGENDIYDQLANEKGSTVYKLQKRFQKVFGFTLPLFHGRGIFNYNYGLLPFRHPIVAVIGRPIATEQCREPTQEMVQEVHQQYITELVRIWDKYKDLYAQNRTRELRVVE
ncbi:diacylglycerol O-acyltransferase 1 [Apiotrichum porosum]|uniref:Diacylglycerol O-acyltransferase n=1 Tax=Apiotrichum porosum TaxID=105984 RepID=A0A427XWP7_9TREE|nr:diacylglycerol O-acyltransferase 1 [Apiotrichum porosum]RSH83326.1 diacylglycerol O-acyltransferase 1 [Apiotrichum porosum]